VDLYKIQICNAAAFSADTINSGMTFDETQLFLFDSSGHGITFNDDDPLLSGYHSHLSAQFVPGNGIYYLAVSGWDQDALGSQTTGEIWADTPYSEERQPDGPASTETLGSWDVGGYYAGRYLITLTGVCGVTPVVCYPNCDASTIAPVLNVNDFTCFLNRYAAGENYANCDASTIAPVLNVNDFTCFLNKYAAGCP
jgi:hypothetical protein